MRSRTPPFSRVACSRHFGTNNIDFKLRGNPFCPQLTIFHFILIFLQPKKTEIKYLGNSQTQKFVFKKNLYHKGQLFVKLSMQEFYFELQLDNIITIIFVRQHVGLSLSMCWRDKINRYHIGETFFAFMNIVSTIFLHEKSLEALNKLDFRSCLQNQYSNSDGNLGRFLVWQNFYH